MAGPPPGAPPAGAAAAGVQPPLPGGAQAPSGIASDERLRQLLALLHTPADQGANLDRQAEALKVGEWLPELIQSLPEQPPPQYGELPGEGYLYADAPEDRQKALVHTNPEVVRNALLRAVEVCSFNSMLPFSENKPEEWAKAALAFAQSYLLLDPSVDEQGIPVGAQQAASGQAQLAVAEAQARGQLAATQAQVDGQHSLAALKAQLEPATETTDPVHFTQGAPTGGHAEPPRVAPNAAQEELEGATKGMQAVLSGARGDLPKTRPRPPGSDS